MKKIVLLYLLITAIRVVSQERKEYKQINEYTVEVSVYYNEDLTQKGVLKLQDKVWVPCGTWYGYNKEGKVIITVEFKDGKKLQFKTLSDNKIVMIDHRREKLILN